MDIQRLLKIAIKINEAFKHIDNLSVDELEEFLNYVNCTESLYSLVNPVNYNELYDKFRMAEGRARILMAIKKKENK